MMAVLVVALVLALAAAVGLALTVLGQGRRLREAVSDARRAGPTAAADMPGADTPAPAAGPARSVEGGFRHMLGLLTHELRTPLGAIVGYQELLAEGLLGPIPERALDAIRRIGTSGSQLRHLIDGISDLMVGDPDSSLELQQVPGEEAAARAAESARALASGRGVTLQVSIPESLPQIVTDPTRLAAALDLAIGAGIRASPGASLALAFAGDDGALVARLDGTSLDPARDRPGPGDWSPATGAGLRLLMASRMVEHLGGELRVEGAAPAGVWLRVPGRPIDGA